MTETTDNNERMTPSSRVAKSLRDPLWQGAAAVVAIVAAVFAILPEQAVCSEPIFEEFIVTPELTKTCSDPSFGQIGWSKTETITQSSGWRGGGSNPQNWCNTLASNFIQSRSLGPDVTSEVVGTPTERSRQNSLTGKVTYNYGCTVKVSWEAVYNSQRIGYAA